jgi:uncharacterized membrane protein
MKKVEKDIHINAPVDHVYNLWTDFERFPNMLHNVKQVSKTGDKQYHWVAEIGGKKVEWDAEVTRMDKNKLIAWNSVSGDKNSGEVRFEPMGNGTHLYLTIVYDPPMGIVGEIADTLTQRMSADTEEDLKNFKKMAESNEVHAH